MQAFERIIEICKATAAKLGVKNVALFDTITDLLEKESIKVDQEATQKAREETPNLIAVVFDSEDGRDYIELIDDEFKIYKYDECLLLEYLLSEKEALGYDLVTIEDLKPLRFVFRDGGQYYDEQDILGISATKESEREILRNEQQVITLELPLEFLKFCEQENTTPDQVLRGFIADLCGLNTHEYIPNGSDERDLAAQYFDRCGYHLLNGR